MRPKEARLDPWFQTSATLDPLVKPVEISIPILTVIGADSIEKYSWHAGPGVEIDGTLGT